MNEPLPDDAESTIPRDYKVPDFGVDSDIIGVQSAVQQSEKNLGTKMTASFGAKAAPVNPRDYVVPDFGID